MASTLRYGSRGNEVKTLQERLNATGYNLTADGIYGTNTLKAVKDYQQKNGLDVDGIVGNNTWGKLLSSETPSATSGYTPTAAPTITDTPTAPTYDTSTWDESTKGSAAGSAYKAAKDALAQHGDFVFSENEWLNSLKDDIRNYGEFSYDVNSDALYQQYAEQYMRQGKLAMQDAMGQAAALTGGYGNSYAATVGNQAYQSYLQQLNDRVPELYKLALDRYNMGKQDLYDQYGMLLSEYEREYGEHSAEYQKLVDALDIASDDYYKGAELHLTEQDINNTNAWEQAKWDEAINQYANEEAWRQKEWDRSQEQYEIQKAQAGVKVDSTGKVVVAPKNEPKTSGVTDAIRTKAASFTSNTSLGDYIDGLIANGTITDAEGDALYAEYVDNNEKYNEETGAISYKDMVGSTNGWTVVDKGGGNLWGIDQNAVVKAPNGETIRLDQLRDKLKAEGMTHAEATDVIKKLQQNLGISSNWMFGW